ncbi:MAG: helix-turn-helix transcriptional regulator [Lachnospiraceae bacterium]|nr:helix-turn-helix transcriptional regulator [Lachnospiraceae bacterium]
MMIHAYQEIYLGKAMSTMGDLFDSAVYEYGIEGAEFVKYFLNSTACRRLEAGEASYLVGKTGTEIVLEILQEVTGKKMQPEIQVQYKRSAEYWCGWSVCYYQWLTSRRFAEIFAAVSFSDLLELYPLLHEADVTRTAEILEKRIQKAFPDTNLRRIRLAYGCSQKELARLSGVSLRSIQMYEQRNKDINHAQAASVYRLAKALGCQIEDLLEK